jgi:HAD superfamily hydrolase (TIGR01509 family)
VTRAVLFDVAGTLAMPEDRDRWLRGAAATAGADVGDRAAAARLAARLEGIGRPGGPYPTEIPPAVAEAYATRDLSPERHRAAYAGLLTTTVDAPLATALYERILVADGWVAYADAAGVLRDLRAAGLRVGAVSNIGFDVRPVLDGLGLLGLLDGCVLSFEEGVTKPDPRIFRTACAALGADPAQTLMVGDHPAADGGAAAAGLRTLILPMTPPGGVHGLAAVLREAGVA